MALFKKNWVSKGKAAQIATHKSILPEVSDSVRNITVAAFKARMTVAERKAVRDSTDPYVEDIWEDLIGRTYVDLDSSDLSAGLGYVVNVLTYTPNFQNLSAMVIVDPSARINELLQDGSDKEKYKGNL